jgi:hypothetical protein
MSFFVSEKILCSKFFLIYRAAAFFFVLEFIDIFASLSAGEERNGMIKSGSQGLQSLSDDRSGSSWFVFPETERERERHQGLLACWSNFTTAKIFVWQLQ